jgi:hypothetical protein
MPKLSAVVAALIVVISVSDSVAFAGLDRDGIRTTDRRSKPSAERLAKAPRQMRDDEPWTGSRTDSAGNSFVCFRTGVGTPFDPGWSLR